MAEVSASTSAVALTFQFPAYQLRTVMRDGEPWFVASDVCDALSIAQTASAMRQLDDDEKGVHSTHTPGGEQKVTIINESGLYSLILTSRKPEAKKFKKWVTSEVLPAIRQTGRYVAPQARAAALPEQSTEQLGRHVVELTRQVTLLMRQVGSLSRKVITTQTKLVKVQERNLALIEGHMGGEEATATIIRMEREGRSRAAIVAATGRNYNAVRQAIFKARERGELPAQASTAQPQQTSLDLQGA